MTVFTAAEMVDMAKASVEVERLYGRSLGELSQILRGIVTIDDPYYMEIPRDAYRALIRGTAV